MTASKLTKSTIIAVALATAIGGTALAANYGGGQSAYMGGKMGNGSMMGRGGGQAGMKGEMRGRWGRGDMSGPMMGPMMGVGEDVMLDRIDGRLAFMKTELNITEAQTQAWDDFAEAVRSTAETRNAMMRSMREEFDSGEFLEQSLPDRLTTQETHMEARLEEIRTVKEALDKLYALLDDTQKETADEVVLPTLGMGMGRQNAGMGGRKGMMHGAGGGNAR